MSSNLDTTIRVKLMGDGKVVANESDVEIKEAEKKSDKNRLILFLSILCIILTIGLLFCLVRYKICDSNAAINSSLSGKKTPCPLSSLAGLNNSATLKNEYSATNWNESRLPPTLKPYLYDINLRINVYERIFNGTTSIRFKCLKAMNFAVVHSDPNLIFDFNGIRIYELLYNDQLGQSLNIKNISYNSFYSYFIFHLQNGNWFMNNRNYVIIFENYNSIITNNLKGIYYSTYVTNNQTK